MAGASTGGRPIAVESWFDSPGAAGATDDTRSADTVGDPVGLDAVDTAGAVVAAAGDPLTPEGGPLGGAVEVTGPFDPSTAPAGIDPGD